MNVKKIFFFCVVAITIFAMTTTSILAQDEPEPRGLYLYTHVPVTSVLENEPIEISINVDEYIAGDRVFIHFKETWEVSYNSFPMGYNPTTESFEFVIDTRFHAKETLDYYLEIMPKNGEKIRLPAGAGNHHQIESFSNLMKILKPIFMFVLILSPVIAVFMFRRIQSSHVQRTAKYQQKIRTRRRKLGRQRQKHYKEYVSKMTGSQKSGSRSSEKPSSSKRTGSPAERKTGPVQKAERKPLDVEKIPAHEADPETTTGELKRELDQILRTTGIGDDDAPSPPSRQREAKAAPRRPARSDASSKKAPQRKLSPKRVPPPKSKPPAQAAKPRQKTAPPPPIPKRKPRKEDFYDNLDKTTPVIPQDTSSLGEEERDKLLDILGLDI